MSGFQVVAEQLTPSLVRQLTHQDVLVEYGCLEPGGCMELIREFIESPNWRCDTEANHYPGGSWLGHLLPGVVFLIWATHWMLSSFYLSFQSKAGRRVYRSHSCFSLPGLPATWKVEAALKVLLPPLAMAMELYLTHCDNGSCHWRTLYCPARSFTNTSTQQHSAWEAANWREGHLDGGHINNWQHASMYPAFVVSGLVDLLAHEADAPEGLQQAYLALSFLVEAMLMGLHKKHTPLDRVVHECLFYAMAATAAFCAAEAAWPRSFLFTCGRVAATYLQAIWFLAAAHIVFDGRPAWDVGGPASHSPWRDDVAPALYSPVLFAAIAAAVPLGMALCWAGLHRLYRRGMPPDEEQQVGAVPSAWGSANGTGGTDHVEAKAYYMAGVHVHADEPMQWAHEPKHWVTRSQSSEEEFDHSDLAGQVLPVATRARG